MSPLNHKDFRSGNLVKYDGRIFELDSIAKEFPTLNTDEFGIGVVDWNNIEAIPLSEDVLVKLGAEKKSSAEFRIGNRLLIYRKFSWWDYGADVELPYTHTLQNFIFAVTNQELIYTP